MSIKTILDELRTKQHDEDFEPSSKCEPTAARPGSLEKVIVLTQRVERGQPLFHPFDECIAATVAMEFEKAKYINRLFKAALQARQEAKRGKRHG